MKIFETFDRSGQILWNSLCQFWNDQSIPQQILYLSSVSWKTTPLYFFSSNNIYFAQKEPIKMKIFETFKCSGQNSSNSSCQFWNDKSIPLQILHHSSFSWHNSSVDFKFILFLLWIKGSHHYPNIVFQLYGTKDGLFEGNLFWVGQYDHPQPLYWRKNYFSINIT